jgi:hypothetical protein
MCRSLILPLHPITTLFNKKASIIQAASELKNHRSVKDITCGLRTSFLSFENNRTLARLVISGQALAH